MTASTYRGLPPPSSTLEVLIALVKHVHRPPLERPPRLCLDPDQQP